MLGLILFTVEVRWFAISFRPVERLLPVVAVYRIHKALSAALRVIALYRAPIPILDLPRHFRLPTSSYGVIVRRPAVQMSRQSLASAADDVQDETRVAAEGATPRLGKAIPARWRGRANRGFGV